MNKKYRLGGSVGLEILEGANEGILIAKIESKKFIYANKSICRMFGYNEKVMLSLSVSDIHPKENLTEVVEKFNGLANGNISTAFETPCLKKDGTVFWANITKSNVIIDEIPCVVGFFSDVTEQRGIGIELENLKNDFERTINRSPAHVFRFKKEKDGDIFAVLSEGIIAEKFGINTKVIGGKSLKNLFLPKDYQKVEKHYRKAFNGEAASFEICLYETWFQTAIVPFAKNEKGDVVEVIGYSMDITALKNARNQLEKSQKLESLGLLAGGIAHDFNNLLSGIFNYTDLAREITNETKVKEYLRITLKTMNRARSLTQQLLTFAKGGTPRRKTAELDPFLREITEFALSGSSVSCAYKIDDKLWPCDYDQNQIAQVIENIVINAQQAMPLGGKIELDARNRVIGKNEHEVLPGGDYVQVSIKDKGIGIPREILQKIFDPFFTTKQKGSGLGLATSYSIVKKHDGHIGVVSAPEKGTTISIILPASKAKKSIVHDNEETPQNKSGKILLMDDEKVIRDTMKIILSKAGYVVVATKDGNEALKVFTESLKTGNKFDIVILDLTVPGGMGGKETVDGIRKLDKKITVIVSSGYSEDPIVQNPAKYGFTASIKKPFVRLEFLKMISNYL